LKKFLKINKIKVFEKKDLLLKVDCKFLSWLGWVVVAKSNRVKGLGLNQTLAIVKIIKIKKYKY
jgi:hypothetical protein